MPIGMTLIPDRNVAGEGAVLQQVLASRELGKDLFSKGVPPHLTLSVHEDDREAEILDAFAGFAPAPAPCDLRSLGVFHGEEGVLFAAPVPTRDLLALHAAWHERLDGPSGEEDYRPDGWMPHVTLTTGLRGEERARALAIAQAGLPIRGAFEGVAVLRFHPELPEPPAELARTRLRKA